MLDETCFVVTLPGAKERPSMLKRRVADIDLYVEMLATRGRSGVVVQENDGPALPYAEWRATRPEPLPPSGLPGELMRLAGGDILAPIEQEPEPACAEAEDVPEIIEEDRSSQPLDAIEVEHGDERVRFVRYAPTAPSRFAPATQKARARR